MRRRLSVRALAVVGAGALVVPILGSMSFASSGSRVSIAGTMATWVRSAHATGNTSASTTMSVDVVLPLRGGSAADNLAESISDPASVNYGKYETPAQFDAAFAPTAATVKTVSDYLKGQGLKVDEVAAGNRWITVEGSVKQVNTAFGVTIKNYSYQGGSHFAPSADVTLPSNIAPLVAGVDGLDDVSGQHVTNHVISQSFGVVSRSSAPKAAATPSSTAPAEVPCSDYYGEYTQTVPLAFGQTSVPDWNCGYTPQQMRSAYGLDNVASQGKGVTVAIVDAYENPNMFVDLNQWSKDVGATGLPAGKYSEDGTSATFTKQKACGGAVGWNEEEALDVESVHGIAPQANIHYVGAKNCAAGLDKALNYLVQTHSADIVSNSWGNDGEPAGSQSSLEHSIFVQGAIEGMGFYFSTGDDGDNTDLGEPVSADYPATDNMVTAVGGTSLAIGKKGQRVFETVWGTSIDPVKFPAKKPAKYKEPLPGTFWGGGGGGTSKLFTQPFYQAGTVPNSLSQAYGPTKMRVIPDVSMSADPFLGYFVELTEDGSFVGFAIGGTSWSAPTFAAVQAIASQGRKVAIGFANPLLYNAGSKAFLDLKEPSSQLAVTSSTGSEWVSIGLDSSLTATKGYDNGTGLGAPSGSPFIKAES